MFDVDKLSGKISVWTFVPVWTLINFCNVHWMYIVVIDPKDDRQRAGDVINNGTVSNDLNVLCANNGITTKNAFYSVTVLQLFLNTSLFISSC